MIDARSLPAPERTRRRSLRRTVAVVVTALLGGGLLGVATPTAQADPAAPDHLVVAAVWGAQTDTGQWANDWIELYNPTDHDISLGTNSGGTVTAGYSLCYRSNTATPQKCSTTVGMWGTVKAHHYFLVWYPSKNTSGVTYTYPPGLTPDLDFSKKTAANGQQVGTDMGGCNTGGQLLLLSSTTSGAATYKGDLSSAAAKAAGIVDGLGWTSNGTTQPDSAETNGNTTITGVSSGTTNACVLARKLVDGAPVDTDVNRTDVAPVTPASFTVHSQISDHVTVAKVDDAEVSRGEAMAPIQVQGSKGTGALGYAADGLPAGVSIDPSTGVISGTPDAGVALADYPVTVTVTDSSPTGAETATTSFTLTVSSTLRVDPVDDVSVRKGEPLTPVQVTAHGGTPGYHYDATGLPTGVAIDPDSGTISGTPTGPARKYAVHVTVTDSGSPAQSAGADLTLNERPGTTAPGNGDPLADLRINEVHTTGTPADDWVELVNTGAAVSTASVHLVSGANDSYTLPAQDIAAGAHVVVEGSDLHAAGLDLAAHDTLDLTELDDTVLDHTAWTSHAATSWARYPDGTGDFGVSSAATRGEDNAVPAVLSQDDLVVAAVYGADGTAFNSDWTELYNPTDHDISLGSIDASTGAVTPNYYQCYRSNASTSCSSMKLHGTVAPHHYFLVWNGHNSDSTVDAHSKGVPPTGLQPDLDFRYGSNDTNTAATKAANDPSGQSNNGFGGCNTGGQLWLLNAASNGTAPGGNLATTAAKATVVDGVGWMAGSVTQPVASETTGLNSGTNNACVITRKFRFGRPVDSDDNSTDFDLADPSSFALHSQASQRVALTAVGDTEVSRGESMDPIAVRADAVYGALHFEATGLPAGITIDAASGVISGTADAADELKAYTVTVTVSDAVPSDTATTSFTLTLGTQLRLDGVADVSVPKGAPIADLHLRAHGGTPPYTYAATGLPTGLALDPATGTISGTPTGPLGRYAVHATVTDSGTGDAHASVSRDFDLVELPPVGGPAGGDPLAGLRINEVRATGTTAQDWVEIVNTGDALASAQLTLEDSAGDTYQVPTQAIEAHGYVVVDGAALAAAGVHLAAKDTLYLTEAEGTLLDQTAWTAYPPSSWARTTDGTGDFGVSAYPTKGAANPGAPVIHPNDLVVSEVNYDNNSTDYYEYSEVTNTTDHPIDFAVYGLTLTKSGAPMTLHDPSDTSLASPTVAPVIPAHGTQLFWWVENQYLGVKTTAQFRSNYGLPGSTPVVLVFGFSSMANSGGDHSFDLAVTQGSTVVSRAYVDTPCAANTINGASVCPATNNNYAEHYATPADRSDPVATVWYNSLAAGGDDVKHVLKQRLSTPTTIDLEQAGFTRAVHLASATQDAVTLHNTASGPVDLSGYVIQRNGAGAGYRLPAGTTVAPGDDLVVAAGDSGLSFAGRDYASLLAPRGYAYSDGVGIADTTGPLLRTLPYDASSGEPPVIDETTGLPLPPAGGLYRPAGVSARGGKVYVSNTGDNVLAALVDGANTIVAGSLTGYGDLGDGRPAVDARLYQPGGVAEDADGNVYIADSGDNVVRVITTDGTIHRFAGTGTAGGPSSAVTSTSTPLTVSLWHPNDVAVDGDGDVLIADTSDNRVLRVTPAGAISVVAGTGKAGYTGDGAAGSAARLSHPAGVAVDAADNVYVADSSNNVVRRVDGATGVITTVAGDYAAGLADNSCLGGYAGDGGPATSARLNDPQGVAVDGAGDLFIADTFNHAIRQVTPDGTISTLVNAGAVAGTGNTSPVGNGSLPATTKLNTPYAVAVDPVTHAIYVADTKNNALDQVVNAARGGSDAGPTEPASQVPVTGSGAAATACAVLTNGPVVSESAPSVTGTPAVGATLTADPGSWTPDPDSYAYQWLRDGVAIDGATASTYAVPATDGGHLLSVSVTALKEDFGSTSATSTAVLVPVPEPGTLTTATPTVRGTVRVGSRVTAAPGAWRAGSAPVTSFAYQWLRNGVAIPRATTAAYTLSPADRGRRLSVRVTGAHAGYTAATATSSAHVVAAGVLRTATPRIVGTAKVGKRLTARPGRWTAGTLVLSGSHLHYQWFAGGKRIAGATRATYAVGRKDRGKRLTVRVTGSSPGYASATRTSARTHAVRPK